MALQNNKYQQKIEESHSIITNKILVVIYRLQIEAAPPTPEADLRT